MKNIEIIGTGSYAPNHVVTNEMLEKLVDTSNEWIVSRTGIESRHISKGEEASDLATKAALEALKDSNVSTVEIDLIIVATCSPDSLVPSVACKVQKNIGAVNAMAFDINAACSGFIFGVDIAKSFMNSGRFSTALVIGTETLSKIVNWKDRNTCVLFGDGAGAAVLKVSDFNGVSYINSKSEGEKWEALTCGIPLENPFMTSESLANNKIAMEGKEIYKFAVRIMESEFNRILNEAQLAKEDIDFIVPHQANIRMIEAFSKKINVSLDKFIINLNKYGNTSGASIPIALDEANKNNSFKKGNKIVIIGFGGGLTYGSALITWNKF
ncbi:beta-ketoacyl-ACP synthase III [Clostridium sp.]|uniref:beta-ketoacyl-ACP synthase III n=1 Tax=Clostridium sp. TaxID=1506 RepID=UPI002FCC4B07